MLTLSPPLPTEGARIRTLYTAYLAELGAFGSRPATHFDRFARTPGHSIQVLRWEGTPVGFAFLRWKDVDGTELREYYIDPAFRGLDIAFLGFQLLTQTWPGRWEGIARATGRIAAFWRWTLRRLRGHVERDQELHGQFAFVFHTH